MTEYWKSNEKKYCDFCKCWLTDNKITISTHEGGKKHKENVARRISEINKKSTKDHKIQMKLDDEMSKMERSAMAAYMKDIQNNGDLTSQLINEKLQETNSVLSVKVADPSPKATATCSSPSTKKSLKWKEMKNDKGQTYYWNVETNETLSEPPTSGFTPIQPEKGAKIKKDKIKIKGKSSSEAKPPKPPSTFMMGPQPRGDDPYGSWTAVNPQPTLDLELPEQKCTVPTVAPIIIEPEKKFKEKQIVKLEDSESSSTEFKKRKINSNAKRNTRQRLDDD